MLFLLTIILPNEGPIRTKLDKLEDEIKAYILLEKKKTTKPEKTIKKYNKTNFISPPEKKICNFISKKEKNLLKTIDIEQEKYWNEQEGLIEY